MPSAFHELLVLLFHNDPALAAELLRGASVSLPAYTSVRLESGEVPQVVPPAYHADQVVALYNGERPVYGIVVEVQLGQDLDKRFTWPIYATTLRGHLRCPANVLVFAPNEKVAKWCAEPIDLGDDNIWRPRVLGPESVPLIESEEQGARSPEMAVLSAMAHGSDPEHGVPVVAVALATCRNLPDKRGLLYWDALLAVLPGVTRTAVEELMVARGYEYQSDFARRYVSEGEAKGKAEALLDVLEARGLPVTGEQRERILSCSDLDRLKHWNRRAVSVSSTEELFAD